MSHPVHYSSLHDHFNTGFRVHWSETFSTVPTSHCSLPALCRVSDTQIWGEPGWHFAAVSNQSLSTSNQTFRAKF